MILLTLNQITILQQSNVLVFYKKHYANDYYGVRAINPNITFLDILIELNKPNGNLYRFVGVIDSLIRIRLFEQLSDLLNVDYNVIYDLWLKK